MKRRCYNKNCREYKYYGGRGIRVCDEWLHNFDVFYNWAYDNCYDDSLTIDRIDVNGNYEPNNCRWVTMKQQARNRRNTRYVTYKDVTKPLSEWCDILGLNYNKILDRIDRYKWNIEKALFTK